MSEARYRKITISIIFSLDLVNYNKYVCDGYIQQIQKISTWNIHE